MNYFVKDGAFYMTSYGKAQKVVNIRRNPRVGLMVEAGNSYSELRGVMVRGRCEIIEDPEAVQAVFAAMAEGRGRAPARHACRAPPSGWSSRSSPRKWSAGIMASSAGDTEPSAPPPAPSRG